MSTMTQTGVCACGNPVTRDINTSTSTQLNQFMRNLPFTCEACVARQEAEDVERDRIEMAKIHAERKVRRLQVAGIPRRLQAIDLDTLDPGPNAAAMSDVLRWASGGILGVLLTGAPGTGKTTLAAGALRKLVQRQRGRWVSAPELLLRLGSSFGDEQRARATEDLMGEGALVLDDIDKIRPTEYGAEHLFVAIDNCIACERPLLVTTNLSLDELASRYPSSHGEAIASRLAGLDVAHRMRGVDRRLSA